MIFKETELKGAFIIEMTPISDERGFFARAWCQKEGEAHGLHSHMVQANHSYNRHRGTLRGLHYQIPPYEEAKLVRCFRGAIYDVIVDLRVECATYLRWVGVEITADNNKMMYVPEGCGHGYQTLEDDTEVFYQATQFYAPDAERGVRWDDPALGVRWPDVDNRVISEKDRSWPPFLLNRVTDNSTSPVSDK